MKIVCTQENLNKGLNITSHLAGKNVNLPILNNVLLEVREGLLYVSSTNLEIGIKTVVRGKMEKPGKITIPAKLLTDYIALQKPGNIQLEIEDNDLLIQTDNNQTKIKGNPADEYPLIPDVENDRALELPISDLKSALGKVAHAATFNDTRPEISGVLFKMSDKKLVLAATDSYRLAEKVLNSKELSDINKDIIVPLRTIHELMRVSPDSDDQKIKVFIEENQIKFLWDETSLVSRLLEGQYPDYQQIIPDNFQTEVNVDRDDMVKAVKMVSLFAKQGFNNVNLKFSKKEISIAVANSQVGESSSRVECEMVGVENEIVFNYKYLLDGLSNMSSNKVIMGINSPTAPGLLKVKDDETFLYLIMPIRQ